MDDDITARIGTFFLLLGVGALILFIASGMAAETNQSMRQDFDYLFFAVIIGGIGLILRRKAPAPPPSGRFSGFKGFIANSKKKKEPPKKK